MFVRRLRTPLLAVLVPVAAAAALAASGPRAQAEGNGGDRAEANERCAVRLSIALEGTSPSASLLASPDPKSSIDAMIGGEAFTERFASFINAEFNGAPSEAPADDPVYYLAKHVIAARAPWSDMFIGRYAITAASATATSMTVTDDPDGLGYFHSPAWMKRYAGNEDAGAMIIAAFRILADTTGLELAVSVGNPGEKRDAAGREASACKGCHFDAWYALDKFAKLLPRKRGTGDAITFAAPVGGAQELLGTTLEDDRQMVEALVASDSWRFAQCRNVFKFLHGRPENQCEAPAFDACVAALETDGTIQAAVAAVAKDASFCQ